MTQLFPVAAQLRQAMRGVASTVTLLATVTPTGDRHAMIASSFTSVSLEPATVLVCIGRHTTIHGLLLAAGRLSINILQTTQQELARACSQQAGEERFAHGNWHRDEASGLPYLADAQAALLCEIGQQHVVGTHSVVLAQVQRVLAEQQEIAPLVYLDGQFGRVKPAVQDAPACR